MIHDGHTVPYGLVHDHRMIIWFEGMDITNPSCHRMM